MTRNWLLLFGVIIFLSACVQNRKIVFLQKDDVQKKILPVDSVMRSYEMKINEYRIQPLDLLYIKVESLTPEDFDFISKLDAAPDNTGGGGGSASPIRIGFLVDTDGFLEYPVLGKVKMAGLTVFEAQSALKELLKGHLTLPSVRVRLLNFRFTALGEVNGEQQVIATNTRVTFMEALGMVGGLTEMADRRKIKVIRQKGSVSEVYYVNLLDENFVTSPFYYIQQNDIIIVPPLKQRPFRRYTLPNAALVFTALSTALFIISLTKK